jgi:magnesium chelatase family protein
MPFDVMTQTPSGETSAQIRERMIAAQSWRKKRGQMCANAQLGSRELKVHGELAPEATRLPRSAMHELSISARSYAKLLRIARTIADLAQSERILPEHIAEAI